MSYATIAACANDQGFVGRVNACAAQEQVARGENLGIGPMMGASTLVWAVAVATDVEAAYESALISLHANPGGDPAVITDQMILSNVQANWPTPPAPPGSRA
jgi:hypothetical protein